MAALLTWQLFLSPAWETCTLFLTKHSGMNPQFLNGTLGSSILQISIKNTKMKGNLLGENIFSFGCACWVGKRASDDKTEETAGPDLELRAEI